MIAKNARRRSVCFHCGGEAGSFASQAELGFYLQYVRKFWRPADRGTTWDFQPAVVVAPRVRVIWDFWLGRRAEPPLLVDVKSMGKVSVVATPAFRRNVKLTLGALERGDVTWGEGVVLRMVCWDPMKAAGRWFDARSMEEACAPF